MASSFLILVLSTGDLERRVPGGWRPTGSQLVACPGDPWQILT